MVSTSFKVEQNVDSLYSIAQLIIGFGTVACMCFLLFLGLKLKWFRAQFKVQEMPKSKKSSDTVQGIGFKIKSNSDDFQRYKSISEFATPDVNLTNPPKNKIQLNDRNDSNIFKKVTIMNQDESNASAKVENSKQVFKTENRSDVNKTESTSTSVATKKNEVLKEIENRGIRSQITTDESKKTRVEESVEKKSKVSFVKNKATEQIKETARVSSSEENIVTQQMRNPLSAQNIVMPQADEDSWQMKIVAEKPEQQIDHRNDDIYYEEINLANSHSSSTISNSMYSSQAASIFFGSYDEKQPPNSPPPPIPRKFLEDDDTISLSSQTSA